MPVLSPLSADALQCCCSLLGTPKVYPRAEAIARRYAAIDRLAYSLRGLDRFHLYPAPAVIRIFMILFILAVGLLGCYAAIEYAYQKVYYNTSIIFYGMVEVYP